VRLAARLLLGIALAGAGCYKPTIASGQLRRDTNGGACPQGFRCMQGACWRPS